MVTTIRILFLALILPACAQSTAESHLLDGSEEDSFHEVHSHYKEMKAFRTYINIQKHWPLRHNFWIWYRDNGFGTKSEMAADSVEEAVSAGRLPGGFQAGSYEYPNDPPGVEVPNNLVPVADALIERLKEINSERELGEFKVRYLGRFSNITVVEQIPQGTWSEDDRVLQTHGSYSFRIDENRSGLQPTTGLGVGTRLFCPDHFPQDCGTEPRLVDFVMPANLEGTTPIAAKVFYSDAANESYEQAFTQLESKILEAVTEIEDGSYINPIASVLAAQGDDFLPQSSRQEVELEISSYLYPEGSGSISERHTFRIKTEELVAGPIELSKEFTDTGFTVTLEVDMPSGMVNLTARHSSGPEQSLALTISSDRILRDGERAYIAGYERIDGDDPDEFGARDIRFDEGELRGLVSLGGDVSPARVWSQVD